MDEATQSIQRKEILREPKMKHLLLILASFGQIALCDYSKEYTEIHGNGIYSNDVLETAQRKANTIQKEVTTLKDWATQSNTALRGIIKIAVKNLRYRRQYRLARQIEQDWKKQDGIIIEIASGLRNIGDYEPLSEWLDQTYEKLEETLGFEVCQVLRLTDIKTFNFGLRVVFRPCAYGYDEFYKHFVTDDFYKGVAPVASYWAVVLGCSIGTYSIGYFFICSPVGVVVEAAVKNKVAPWSAPKIYNAACTNIVEG